MSQQVILAAKGRFPERSIRPSYSLPAFDEFPKSIHLIGRKLGEGAIFTDFSLHFHKAACKFIGRIPESTFGIDREKPGEVHHGKEEI